MLPSIRFREFFIACCFASHPPGIASNADTFAMEHHLIGKPWPNSLSFILLIGGNQLILHFVPKNRTAHIVHKMLKIMKEQIHPTNYRFVVFKDMSNGYTFLSRSTAPSKETTTWEDGKEYPLIKLEISNTSHPFYTGKNVLVDTAGRIDKFKKRYEKK